MCWGESEWLAMGTEFRSSFLDPSPLPHTHPRAPVFGLTSESYQPPWVVCGSDREKGTSVVGGDPNARCKTGEISSIKLRVDWTGYSSPPKAPEELLILMGSCCCRGCCGHQDLLSSLLLCPLVLSNAKYNRIGVTLLFVLRDPKQMGPS